MQDNGIYKTFPCNDSATLDHILKVVSFWFAPQFRRSFETERLEEVLNGSAVCWSYGIRMLFLYMLIVSQPYKYRGHGATGS